MTKPKMEELDLTGLQDDGVLMAANEAFFWPLGLALTWFFDEGKASRLHVTQWDFGDGHRETITVEEDDEVAIERRRRFAEWRARRMLLLPEEERT